MHNRSQIERYRLLRRYIDAHFKEDLNIEKIEKACFYSYRNINRIFQGLHQETIGKYIKRIRLEKAAEYLKYSDLAIMDIAMDVGFSDVASFGKAFKTRFGTPPAAFRKLTGWEIVMNGHSPEPVVSRQPPLPFEIEYLPDFEMLYVEYRGDYRDIDAIEKQWQCLLEYCESHQLLTEESIFMAEILDDNEICDDIVCRYNVALILDKPLCELPRELLFVKRHAHQKYAKFVHRGPHETCMKTYDQIYANWITHVHPELVDLPTLEFFVNHHLNPPPNQLLTEIYIPVQ